MPPDALAVVRRAAEIEGRSVSDFVVAATHEAAQRTVEQAQLISLPRYPAVPVARMGQLASLNVIAQDS